MSNKIVFFIVLIFLLSVNSANAQFQPLRNLSISDQHQSLDAANKQIENSRNQQVRSPLNLPVKENTNNFTFIGFITILVFILTIFGYYGIPVLKEKMEINNEFKKIKREEEKEARKISQQIRQQEMQNKEREEFQRKSDFMDRIRQTPRYQRWREEVQEKCGNKCQIDKSHADRYAEVHHLISLSKILKQNNIISIEGALGCRQLWDIDNGVVLCKECHDQMESSQIRQTIISKK